MVRIETPYRGRLVNVDARRAVEIEVARPRRSRWRWLAIQFLRVLLAVVFLAAAAPKITHPDQFAASVSHYLILPSELSNIVAIFIPWLELTAALCLVLVSPLRRAAAVTMIVLLTVFTAAQAWAFSRGLQINCGCFGSQADPIGWSHLVRNGLLLLLAAIMARIEFGYTGLHRHDRSSIPAPVSSARGS